MICSDCTIEGEVFIDASAILQPKASIIASEGNTSTIAELAILEEYVHVLDSSIGSDCLLEVGAYIVKSTIGLSTKLSPKSRIENSTIGNNCIITPSVHLVNATIPDNSCVFMVDGIWKYHRMENTAASNHMESNDMYRKRLLAADSQQNMTRHFTAHPYHTTTSSNSSSAK